MTQDEPVRLLLAEDQVMIREALAALLSFEGDIEVVAQVGRGDEVLTAAEATRPHVAVLDIEMPGMDGLTAAAELKKRSPDTKIVILTTFGRPGFLRRAMESGVSAFLVKDSPADKLTQTIRRVLAGERVIDPDLAAAALADGLNPLTPRATCSKPPPTAGRSPRSPPTSTSPRARCGTTCPPASRRPGPGTAPRRFASPPSAAGSRARRDPETLG
jgi:two-component system response regulator DesR